MSLEPHAAAEESHRPIAPVEESHHPTASALRTPPAASATHPRHRVCLKRHESPPGKSGSTTPQSTEAVVVAEPIPAGQDLVPTHNQGIAIRQICSGEGM